MADRAVNVFGAYRLTIDYTVIAGYAQVNMEIPGGRVYVSTIFVSDVAPLGNITSIKQHPSTGDVAIYCRHNNKRYRYTFRSYIEDHHS